MNTMKTHKTLARLAVERELGKYVREQATNIYNFLQRKRIFYKANNINTIDKVAMIYSTTKEHAANNKHALRVHIKDRYTADMPFFKNCSYIELAMPLHVIVKYTHGDWVNWIYKNLKESTLIKSKDALTKVFENYPVESHMPHNLNRIMYGRDKFKFPFYCLDQVMVDKRYSESLGLDGDVYKLTGYMPIFRIKDNKILFGFEMYIVTRIEYEDYGDVCTKHENIEGGC